VLRVEELTKIYFIGDRHSGGGIRNVEFAVGAGEFYTLLGPSGCGKTTTLRSVAGLEEPTSGRVTIDGRAVFDSARGEFVPVNKRNIGMVFQSYAVWPHMTVFENAAFPLRMSRTRRWSERDIAARVTRVLETTGLAMFMTRSATQLSGGQQQRLALARALVAEPRLLLLDEPLSNLDALLREQMRVELRRLQKDVGVTAIYVTHDQSEALALSDRIAVMCDGSIAQIGTPRQVYHRPANAFVAAFIGRSNLLHGHFMAAVAPCGRAPIQTPLGPILCECPTGAAAAQPVSALIRPEHVVLAAAASASDSMPPNRFRGQVVQVAFLGEAIECLVRVGESVEILVRSVAGDYAPAEAVDVFFPPERTIAVVSAGTPPVQ
jgi:iron(III) transport system ATP-binding protein